MQLQEPSPFVSFDVVIEQHDIPAIAAYVKRTMTKEAKRSLWQSDFALIAFVDVLGLIGVGIIAASEPNTPIVIGSALLAAAFVGIQLAVNVIAKRQLRRALDDLRGNFRLDETGLSVSQPGRHAFIATEVMLDLDVTPTHVFLRPTSQQFFVMPRRCIGGPDEQARVLALLARVPS